MLHLMTLTGEPIQFPSVPTITLFMVVGHHALSCPGGALFEPTLDEFVQGFLRPDSSSGKCKFSEMGQVNVPNQPVPYSLSWRWDCEEADQVWTSCADIEIVDGSGLPRPLHQWSLMPLVQISGQDLMMIVIPQVVQSKTPLGSAWSAATAAISFAPGREA